MRNHVSGSRSAGKTKIAVSALLGSVALAASLAVPANAEPADPTIDLYVLYTPETLQARGSATAVNAAIEASVQGMNGALSRSLIPGKVRLVGTEVASANESTTGRGGKALDWVSANGSKVREAHKADLVSLVISGGEGMAQIPGVPISGANSNPAFSVVGNDWLEPDLTRGEAGVLAHELGHNLGAKHDWASSPQAGVHPERHGFASTVTGQIDIMAYTTSSLCPDKKCKRQPYYSNPDLVVNGEQFGTRGGDRPSDIASIFRQSIPEVAKYR